MLDFNMSTLSSLSSSKGSKSLNTRFKNYYQLWRLHYEVVLSVAKNQRDYIAQRPWVMDGGLINDGLHFLDHLSHLDTNKSSRAETQIRKYFRNAKSQGVPQGGVCGPE